MKTEATIEQLRVKNEDFEWYPTTPEIISTVNKHVTDGCSFLDVGAGRGDVLAGITKADKKFAIEKSMILLQQLPADTVILGTDFHQSTLIDKPMDYIFSNPPYSEFATWAVRLIKEAYCRKLFLVLPQRWKDNKSISHALEMRKASPRVVGSYDFLNAERRARAVVDLIEVSLGFDNYGNISCRVDPFHIWLEENISVPDIPEDAQPEYHDSSEPIPYKDKLVKGRNLVEALVECYTEEIDRLSNAYSSLSNVPGALLKELGVSKRSISDGLMQKIKNLKRLYWQEIFDNMNELTSRLTTQSRKKLVEELQDQTHIDFTISNVYAVVLWALKNANLFIPGQLVAVYKRLSTEKDSLHPYKSNRHWTDNTFRFSRWDFNATHYAVDYRVIVHAHDCFDAFGYRRINGLAEASANIIDDVCTIGKTLGFQVQDSVRSFQWQPGKENVFTSSNEGRREIFMKVRCHKNGNIHFKFNKNFLMAFNIEAGRLLGWLHNPRQAANEIEGIKMEDAENCFGKTLSLSLERVKMLVG